MKSQRTIYKLATSFFSGISLFKLKELLVQIPQIEHLFEFTDSELESIYNVNNAVIKKLNRTKALQLANDQMKNCLNNGYQFFYFMDEDYPILLRQCADAPVIIYVKGQISFKNKKFISIVGTRNNTNYGQEILKSLIPKFSFDENIVIVSGLAYGIDILTHRLCLENNIKNIAVLGHGLDRIYPCEHRFEAMEIQKNGLLLTEFPHSSPIKTYNFPKRNRIIAGLSMATLVIESLEKGGSLITAKTAFDYDREVFCFPGNVFQKHSKGCNDLIKKGIAHPLENFNDLCDQLNWNVFEKNPITTDGPTNLNEKETFIYSIFQKQKTMRIDDLVNESSLSIHELNIILLEFELKSYIKRLSQNQFQFLD